MFYVYILYMWPTVWIRSIIIILNSIYHYQFGMKACYIYLFVCLRKTTFSDTFWLIQCFFSDMQNVNIHWLVFWKVHEKESSRENPQLGSLKLNVTEYYALFCWLLLGILHVPYKFISKCSGWFLEDIIL